MTIPTAPLVFVVDDDASVRKSLVRLIRTAGYEVEPFGSVRDFLARAPYDGPSCLVLDVRMPGSSGLDLQEALKATRRPLAIVFITGHRDIPMSVKAMRGGAVDFLTKPVDESALLGAIQQAVTRTIADRREQSRVAEIRQRIDTLTPREATVLAMVVTGMLNKQIGSDLGIAEKTVKVHRWRRASASDAPGPPGTWGSRSTVRSCSTPSARWRGRECPTRDAGAARRLTAAVCPHSVRGAIGSSGGWRPNPGACVAVQRGHARGDRRWRAFMATILRTHRQARVVLVTVSTAFGLAAASGAAPVGLSADQQDRVAAGEVVLLDALPSGASQAAGGGTAVGLVRAAPERVWAVLVDYRGHPRYYPRVITAEPVEVDAQHVVVRYEVGVGPFSFGFHMVKYPDPARRRIDWRLDADHANNFFRENTGYWQVDPAEGGSVVTYAIAVRTILPGFVTRGAERRSLVDTIKKLRKLVED